MDHKVLTALTFHTLLVLIVAIHLSAGWKGSEPFLQKCSQNVKAEMCDVPETLREPVEQNGQGDVVKYLYRFPLLENSLGNCSSGLKTLNLNTSVRGSVFWTSTGYLVTPSWSYPPERHCISGLTKDEIQVRVCPPKCDGNEVCIQKCCNPGSVLATSLTGTTIRCTNSSEWMPNIYKTANERYENPEEFVFYYNVAPPNLLQEMVFTPTRLRGGRHARIRLLLSGKVLTKKSGNHKWEEVQAVDDQYCVDGFLNYEDPSARLDLTEEQSQILLASVEQDCKLQAANILFSSIYFACYVISSLMGFATVVAYLLVWETHNIHGWCIGTFSACELLHFVSFAIAHGARRFSHHEIMLESAACYVNSLLVHFGDIVVNSWLNVLGYDFWKTINSRSPQPQCGSVRQYLSYCAYGFGIPLTVVTVGVIMDLSYDLDSESVIRPQYGMELCAVDRSAFIYYTGGINLLLYGISLSFAGCNVHTLCRLKRETRILNSNSSIHTKIYVKISILMGTTWIIDFIGWLTVSKLFPKWHWAVFDIGNIIQSVGIFVIFVCNKEMRDRIVKKYKISPGQRSASSSFELYGPSFYRPSSPQYVSTQDLRQSL